MTAKEQLEMWAAAPNDEVFVWLHYPEGDQPFVGLASDEHRPEFSRMRASDVLTGLQRATSSRHRMTKDVLARFQPLIDDKKSMRLDHIRGIACVIVEGQSPVSPHVPYRLVLSSVEAFLS